MTRFETVLSVVALAAVLGACEPTIKVEAPDKPVTININVKIDHEIRVKVDKALDDLFSKDKELF